MITAILAGFSAGAVHVLAGPDHLAAVAPLAAERSGRSWMTGLLWGLGHGGGVLIVGLGALLLRELIPLEAFSAWSERAVGVVLIGIGVWGVQRATRQRLHAHQHAHDGFSHAHIHIHQAGYSHESRDAHAAAGAHAHVATSAAFGVGILHGLAGSAHVLGVLPALGFPTRFQAAAYVSFFALGTVMAMTAFAELIGRFARRFGGAGTRLYRALLLTFAGAAIGVGIVWLAA